MREYLGLTLLEKKRKGNRIEQREKFGHEAASLTKGMSWPSRNSQTGECPSELLRTFNLHVNQLLDVVWHQQEFSYSLLIDLYVV